MKLGFLGWKDAEKQLDVTAGPEVTNNLRENLMTQVMERRSEVTADLLHSWPQIKNIINKNNN